MRPEALSRSLKPDLLVRTWIRGGPSRPHRALNSPEMASTSPRCGFESRLSSSRPVVAPRPKRGALKCRALFSWLQPKTSSPSGINEKPLFSKKEMQMFGDIPVSPMVGWQQRCAAPCAHAPSTPPAPCSPVPLAWGLWLPCGRGLLSLSLSLLSP